MNHKLIKLTDLTFVLLMTFLVTATEYNLQFNSSF